MEKYHSKISKYGNVELVQVSGDKNVQAAINWAKKENFPWPTILREDIGKTIIKNIKFPGYPTYVLIDKNGKEITRAHSSVPLLKKLDEITAK